MTVICENILTSLILFIWMGRLRIMVSFSNIWLLICNHWLIGHPDTVVTLLGTWSFQTHLLFIFFIPFSTLMSFSHVTVVTLQSKLEHDFRLQGVLSFLPKIMERWGIVINKEFLFFSTDRNSKRQEHKLISPLMFWCTASPLHTNLQGENFQSVNVHLVPARNQNLCHQCQAWVNLQLTLHLLLLTILQLYHLPPPPLLQSVTLLACSLDASPCMPAFLLYCCTIHGTVL